VGGNKSWITINNAPFAKYEKSCNMGQHRNLARHKKCSPKNALDKAH
jgi:hypothetical protein